MDRTYITIILVLGANPQLEITASLYTNDFANSFCVCVNNIQEKCHKFLVLVYFSILVRVILIFYVKRKKTLIHLNSFNAITITFCKQLEPKLPTYAAIPSIHINVYRNVNDIFRS